jgi:hypothetical protein
MGLLKTVFEVNLTLFGKREGEKCVSFHSNQNLAAGPWQSQLDSRC